MKRYHITLGASTSAGGKVISASSACSINGIKIALEGDRILCPACKSSGTIRIFGSRIPESWNGKQVALQDDLCVCGCPSPPKLIASQRLKYQDIGGGSGGASGGGSNGGSETRADGTPEQVASAARQEMQTEALKESDDKIVLRLVDDYTQQPLSSKRYRLEFGEKVLEGQTDADGYTGPLDVSDRDQLVAWQIIE